MENIINLFAHADKVLCSRPLPTGQRSSRYQPSTTTTSMESLILFEPFNMSCLAFCYISNRYHLCDVPCSENRLSSIIFLIFCCQPLIPTFRLTKHWSWTLVQVDTCPGWGVFSLPNFDTLPALSLTNPPVDSKSYKLLNTREYLNVVYSCQTRYVKKWDIGKSSLGDIRRISQEMM